MAVRRQQNEKQINKKKTSATKDKKKTTTKKNTDNTNKKYNKDTLSERELKFIDAYLETANVIQSVRRAGYKAVTDATASSIGNRVLKKDRVRKEIDARRVELTKSSIATAQEVMEYFTKVMHGEIKDQFGLDAPLSERTRAAQELAKRTVDIDNRNRGQADAKVEISLNWKRD